MDLHEILSKGWQQANEQTIKLVAIQITDPNLYHDTGKTCLSLVCTVLVLLV